MSKLKKSQNIIKTAEEKALELDREMSMDTKIIGKFITQKVAVAMAEKTKQYEKKIKKLEKSGSDKVLGELTTKNGTRGGGRASKNRRYAIHQTKDDIRSHLCFGLGGVHTPVSIQ